MLEIDVSKREKPNRRPIISNLDRSQFEPAKKSAVLHQLNRPSLSYWQDAWRRFKRNKQAMAALYLVISLVLFVTVGPFIWTVDPASQNLLLPSVPPSWKTAAIVMDALPAWEPIVDANIPAVPAENVSELPAPSEVTLVVAPTTLGVRLHWTGVSGASGYSIYRNEFKPEPGNLGVPMGETSEGNQVSYEDISALEVKKYFYSIVPKNLNGEESSNSASIMVDVERVATLSDAQIYDPNIKEGDKVVLPIVPAGTDSLGRDMLARLMYGGRVSLFIGFLASLTYVALGILIGGIAGYAGGKIDDVLMRFTDFVTGLPFLLFMILLKVVLQVGPGESGIGALILALVVLSWTGTARLVRGQVMQLRDSDFVQATRLLGGTPTYILLRHMIPNLLGIILVALTFGIPAAIFSEAFLSFIGLGVASPATSWGAMCYDGVLALFNHPHIFFLPGIMISITVLAFNLLGDGLRDALDPKLRSVE